MGKIQSYCYKKILSEPLNIEQRFVCANSLDQYNLQAEQLIISAEKIDRTSLINKLSQAEKVFTF